MDCRQLNLQGLYIWSEWQQPFVYEIGSYPTQTNY